MLAIGGGSPGMEGRETELFVVQIVTEDGTTREFSRH
jgi:hypothetical protein